jgi:hypothetical protein
MGFNTMTRGMASAVTPNATYTGDTGIPTRVLTMRESAGAVTVYVVSGGTLPPGSTVTVPARRVVRDAR